MLKKDQAVFGKLCGEPSFGSLDLDIKSESNINTGSDAYEAPPEIKHGSENAKAIYHEHITLG